MRRTAPILWSAPQVCGISATLRH